VVIFLPAAATEMVIINVEESDQPADMATCYEWAITRGALVVMMSMGRKSERLLVMGAGDQTMLTAAITTLKRAVGEPAQ
jgi:hypothetical protein